VPLITHHAVKSINVTSASEVHIHHITVESIHRATSNGMVFISFMTASEPAEMLLLGTNPHRNINQTMQGKGSAKCDDWGNSPQPHSTVIFVWHIIMHWDLVFQLLFNILCSHDTFSPQMLQEPKWENMWIFYISNQLTIGLKLHTYSGTGKTLSSMTLIPVPWK
jgi:hypothetical protein